jgi:hypothetical protein
MLNVQGLGERIPLFVLFGAIPFALGASLVAMVDRPALPTAVVAIGLPILGIGACFLFWATGYYSDEGLLGAWLICLPAIPAYIAGTLGGFWWWTRRHSMRLHEAA